MEDLSKLKVPELKERLKALRLPLQGKKADLLARLQAAVHHSTTAPASIALRPPQSTLAGSSSTPSQSERLKPVPTLRRETPSTQSKSQSALKGKEKALDPVAEAPPLKKARLEPLATCALAPAVVSSLESPNAAAPGPKAIFAPLIAGSSPSPRPSVSPSVPGPALKDSGVAVSAYEQAHSSRARIAKPTRVAFKPLIPSARFLSSAPTRPVAMGGFRPFSPPGTLFDTRPHITASQATSFLAASWPQRLYASLSPPSSFSSISPSLYSSPSHPHQFDMAYRFVVSRLFLTLSRGTHESMAEVREVLQLLPAVLDAQPVVEGLWLIELSDGSRLHVLDATGEVVGSEQEPEALALGQPNRTPELKLRADWAQWVEEMEVGRGKRLYVLIRGGDEEGYIGGLSESVKSKSAEDEQLARSVVRYLMAQATPNSISGTHATPLAEAHFAASLQPSITHSVISNKLGFYLPTSLCLESLHLPSPSSKLHPDLMVAQTAGLGGMICLRETGQVIGSDEEGVRPMWSTLLGCSERGEVE